MAKKKIEVKKKLPPGKNKKPHLAGLGRGFGTGAGKPKNIATPEELWRLFEMYVRYSKTTPLKKHVGYSKGKKVYEERERAIVFIAFEGWLAMEGYLSGLNNYFKDPNYVPILAAIRKACSNDTIIGALGGVYNANLTARLEKLSEHVDTTTNGKDLPTPAINVYNDGPKLASSESEVDGNKKKSK